MTGKELFQYRNKLVRDALQWKSPERTPISSNVTHWMFHDAGYSTGTAVRNYDIIEACMKRFVTKYPIDHLNVYNSGFRNYFLLSDPLDRNAYDGAGSDGSSLSYITEERFSPDEYDELTNVIDPEDPDLPLIEEKYIGDYYGLHKADYQVGNTMMWLAMQYGYDKWDLSVWYFPWLEMAKKEGLLDDLDFGMEVDVSNPEFVKHFLYNMTYRIGLGDIFAEGMARAIRKLGKEKYGDTIYHGRYNTITGQQLDIPVSFESGWGHCSHWQGRGFEGCPPHYWLVASLTCMVDSRDAVCSQHYHDWVDNYKEYKDDPVRSRKLVQVAIHNDAIGELKDSLVSCEFKTPNIARPGQESELFHAATGIAVTEEDLLNVGEQSKLLFRAILMRDYGRTREMEVAEMYPYLTYPDPWGNKLNWDEWNNFADMYYEERGWDLETGWPTRSVWEKYGLSDLADELEALGKLPPEGRKEYTRKPNPIGR